MTFTKGTFSFSFFADEMKSIFEKNKFVSAELHKNDLIGKNWPSK